MGRSLSINKIHMLRPNFEHGIWVGFGRFKGQALKIGMSDFRVEGVPKSQGLGFVIGCVEA